MFLVNLPLAFGAAFLAWRYVSADRAADEGHLDIGGAILATLGLGTMTWGLIVGSGPPGFNWQALTLLGVGAALLVGFVLWERRQGDRAMMPLAMFSTRSFAGLTLLTLLLYGALPVVPFIIIHEFGLSVVLAGSMSAMLLVGTRRGWWAALMLVSAGHEVGEDAPLLLRMAHKLSDRVPWIDQMGSLVAQLVVMERMKPWIEKNAAAPARQSAAE